MEKTFNTLKVQIDGRLCWLYVHDVLPDVALWRQKGNFRFFCRLKFCGWRQAPKRTFLALLGFQNFLCSKNGFFWNFFHRYFCSKKKLKEKHPWNVQECNKKVDILGWRFFWRYLPKKDALYDLKIWSYWSQIHIHSFISYTQQQAWEDFPPIPLQSVGDRPSAERRHSVWAGRPKKGIRIRRGRRRGWDRWE